jgi:hypothetical protein
MSTTKMSTSKVVIAAGVIVIAVVGWWYWNSGPAPIQGSIDGKAWFTIDDGKSWFAEDARKIPPFDHQGKPAVLCFVYKSKTQQPWVSHLLRYTPEGKKSLEERRAKGIRGFAMPGAAISEVKKPGTSQWVSSNDPMAVEIQTPRAPDGSTDGIEPVEPNQG